MARPSRSRPTLASQDPRFDSALRHHLTNGTRALFSKARLLAAALPSLVEAQWNQEGAKSFKMHAQHIGVPERPSERNADLRMRRDLPGWCLGD